MRNQRISLGENKTKRTKIKEIREECVAREKLAKAQLSKIRCYINGR